MKSGETKMLLEVGKDKEGREQVINRRVGRNELDMIQVCLAYVDAQLEYYRRNPLKEPLRAYA